MDTQLRWAEPKTGNQREHKTFFFFFFLHRQIKRRKFHQLSPTISLTWRLKKTRVCSLLKCLHWECFLFFFCFFSEVGPKRGRQKESCSKKMITSDLKGNHTYCKPKCKSKCHPFMLFHLHHFTAECGLHCVCVCVCVCVSRPLPALYHQSSSHQPRFLSQHHTSPLSLYYITFCDDRVCVRTLKLKYVFEL